MDLVVDANVLFSAAIKDSATPRSIGLDERPLHAPEYLFEEFERYRETLLERTHRDVEDFTTFIEILRGRISMVPRAKIDRSESEAESIRPDPGDVPYFALALALDARLWSDDSVLREQSVVPVVTTAELLELVNP